MGKSQGPGCSVWALYEKLWVISPLEFLTWSIFHSAYLWLKVYVHNNFSAFLWIESKLGNADSWLEKGSENKYNKYCHKVRNTCIQQPTSGSSREAKEHSEPSSEPLPFCNEFQVVLETREEPGPLNAGKLVTDYRPCQQLFQDNGSKAEQDYFQSCLQTQGNEETAPIWRSRYQSEAKPRETKEHWATASRKGKFFLVISGTFQQCIWKGWWQKSFASLPQQQGGWLQINQEIKGSILWGVQRRK